MNRRQFCGLALSSAVLTREWLGTARAASAHPFFFRDGDRVVMIGDSITEQHLHSNYVESYILSRFPDWKLTFRNAGIGGDTSTGGNRRTERDVLSFKPTAVTITFGMNDAGYKYPPDPARMEAYRTGLQGMVDQLKGKGVRVAILSSSPVEKKEDGSAMEGYNQTLEQFAFAARDIAERNQVEFVDQFHPHLAMLQRARTASASNRINGGDAVHPGPSGQIMMAWAILKGLNAPALVSSAEVDAVSGETVRSRNCGIISEKKTPTGISFIRSDRALPFWVPPQARSILQWVPVVEDLDQYLLKVTGLPAGSYNVMVDGEKYGTFSAAELAAGPNLALLADGPIARQAQALSDAVFAKNKYYHDQIFRGVVLNGQVPEAQKAAETEERMKGMPAMEEAVRAACVLKPHFWEIARA